MNIVGHSLRFPEYINGESIGGEQVETLSDKDELEASMELYSAVSKDSAVEVAQRIRRGQVFFDRLPAIFSIDCPQSILQFAVCRGAQRVVAFLLDIHRSSVNETESFTTPLITAIQTNQLEIARSLITKKADVNLVHNRVAPIQAALHRLEATQFVIESGASVNYKNEEGISLLNQVLFYSPREICSTLYTSLGKQGYCIQNFNKEKIAPYLVLQGADLDEVDLEKVSDSLKISLEISNIIKAIGIMECLNTKFLIDINLIIIEYLFKKGISF